MRGIIQRVGEWLRTATELPCGCTAADGRGARFSNATTVVNRDLHTTHVEEYRNCTKYNQEWEVYIRCDQCGAEWTERTRAGSKVAYGEKNPGARRKLKTNYVGRTVQHNDKPVVAENRRRGGGRPMTAGRRREPDVVDVIEALVIVVVAFGVFLPLIRLARWWPPFADEPEVNDG